MCKEIDFKAGDVRVTDEIGASADDLLFCADLTWLIRRSQQVKDHSNLIWAINPTGKNQVALRFQSGQEISIKFNSNLDLVEQIVKNLNGETANA